MTKQKLCWHNVRACALASLALFAAAASGAAADGSGPAPMKPYTARYQAGYRGLSGGQIECSFKQDSVTGHWIYDTRAFPNLLARLAVSPQAHEHAIMIIGASGVRPLSYELNNGTSDTSKDVKLVFDWTKNRVSGREKNKSFEIDVPPGTQDTASAQAAMMIERLAGRTPSGFPILTGDEVNDFRYWTEGIQQVVTPFGQFETEVWASQGPHSDRVLKVWYAPSLGYVPVQSIQYRKGNPEFFMKLQRLER